MPRMDLYGYALASLGAQAARMGLFGGMPYGMHGTAMRRPRTPMPIAPFAGPMLPGMMQVPLRLNVDPRVKFETPEVDAGAAKSESEEQGGVKSEPDRPSLVKSEEGEAGDLGLVKIEGDEPTAMKTESSVVKSEGADMPSTGSRSSHASRRRFAESWSESLKPHSQTLAVPRVSPSWADSSQFQLALQEDVLCREVIPRVDIQGQGNGALRRFRASRVEDVEEDTNVEWTQRSVCGPWRVDRADAVKDSERLTQAFRRGDAEAMDVEAIALHTGLPPALRHWEFQYKAAQGGHSRHRCCAHFLTRMEAGALLPPEEILTAPWRPTPVRAEEDFWSIVNAFNAGGLAAARKDVSLLNTTVML